MSRFHLRFGTVLIASIILLNLLIVWVFTVSNNRSYETLAQKQAERLLATLDQKTEVYFHSVLDQIAQSNQMMRDQIKHNQTYFGDGIDGIEAYLQFQSQRLQSSDIPVSEIFYGDIDGNAVGMCLNADGSRNLMRFHKDTGRLVIYNGSTADAEVLESYPSYQASQRPWYTSISGEMTAWSAPYVSLDARDTFTVSVSSPLMENGKQIGVVASSISLDTLSKYLEQDPLIGSGVIYAIDENDMLLVNSSSDNHYRSTRRSNGEISLQKAANVGDPLIRESMKHIEDHDEMGMFTYTYDEERYYAYVGGVKGAWGMDLRIVVVIPESDLLYDIQTQQNASLGSAVFVVITVLLIEILVISGVTASIEQTTRAAIRISGGDYQVELPRDGSIIRETYELNTAFNTMAHDINLVIQQLLSNEQNLEDIIDEKTQKLEDTYQMLLEREKAASLGNLVAGLAHEINTPIGVAISAASYVHGHNAAITQDIADGKLTRDRFQDYIESTTEGMQIVQKNLERASDLIVNFKQISVDQASLVRSEFFVKEYIESLMLTLKHEYKNKKVSYLIDCPDDIKIYSSPGAFAQILTNLILNSIKHGLDPSRHLHIGVRVRMQGQRLNMVYEDDGYGIAQEHLKRVFEPFFTTKHGDGGTGLGLSIVYNLVTGSLGGEISCRSTLNQGTAFTIDLPV